MWKEAQVANWCVNQIDVDGDEAEVARLVEFVKGDTSTNEDAVLDFRKVVPPPSSEFYLSNEGQNDFQCGCKDQWVELTDLPKIEQVRYVDGKEVNEMVYQHEKQVNGKKIVLGTPDTSTIRGFVDAEFGGTELCPDHLVARIANHPDFWYNWNLTHWGTKWSAGEVWNDRISDESKVEGHTSYNFDTAWSPAEPIAAALAEKFPTLSITHRYCEGGMGFAGQVIYLNGEQSLRDDYSADDNMPDEAWIKEEDGSNSYDRDYDKVPMTSYERFCDEHFGGIVGG
jgi:hypothetical protein